jgi:hypothetical protein
VWSDLEKELDHTVVWSLVEASRKRVCKRPLEGEDCCNAANHAEHRYSRAIVVNGGDWRHKSRPYSTQDRKSVEWLAVCCRRSATEMLSQVSKAWT